MYFLVQWHACKGCERERERERERENGSWSLFAPVKIRQEKWSLKNSFTDLDYLV